MTLFPAHRVRLGMRVQVPLAVFLPLVLQASSVFKAKAPALTVPLASAAAVPRQLL